MTIDWSNTPQPNRFTHPTNQWPASGTHRAPAARRSTVTLADEQIRDIPSDYTDDELDQFEEATRRAVDAAWDEAEVYAITRRVRWKWRGQRQATRDKSGYQQRGTQTASTHAPSPSPAHAPVSREE